MSWIVETLLLNRYSIKSGAFGKEYYTLNGTTVETFFGDEDLYLDLLFLEKNIQDMIDKNLFTPYELSILDLVSGGDTYTALGEALRKHRGTVSRKFRNICSRIAFYVGGQFTDEGYIEYMKTKYKLKEHQVELLRQYINSRFRHTIRRTPYDGQ